MGEKRASFYSFPVALVDFGLARPIESKPMKKLLQVVLITTSFAILSGCASAERDSSTPEGAFSAAQHFEENDRFEEAIRRYNEVRNKFPYSSWAVKAELAVADVYFKQESFAEAQVAYQNFRDLHPTHAQIDYVQFRIGISIFNQLPETIDRDLSIADECILAFSDLLKKYPTSSYVEEAKEKRTKVIRMKAEKEEYIADFYFKREMFDSALKRYENLYSSYGGLGFEKKALYRLALCSKSIDDTARLKKYSDELINKYGDSDEAKKIQKELR